MNTKGELRVSKMGEPDESGSLAQMETDHFHLDAPIFDPLRDAKEFATKFENLMGCENGTTE